MDCKIGGKREVLRDGMGQYICGGGPAGDGVQIQMRGNIWWNRDVEKSDSLNAR